MGSDHGTSARVNLNHNNEICAWPHTAGDEPLPAGRRIGAAPSAHDRRPDDVFREVGADLPAVLVFSTSMAQCRLCQRDPPPRAVQDGPQDGAEAPIVVVDAALSIDSYGAQGYSRLRPPLRERRGRQTERDRRAEAPARALLQAPRAPGINDGIFWDRPRESVQRPSAGGPGLHARPRGRARGEAEGGGVAAKPDGLPPAGPRAILYLWR